MAKIKEGRFTYEEAKNIIGECSLCKKSIYVRDVCTILNYGYYRGYGYKAVYEDKYIWVAVADNSLWVEAKI